MLGDFALAPARAGGAPQCALPGAAACSGGSAALGTGPAAEVSGGSAPKSSVCVPEAQAQFLPSFLKIFLHLVTVPFELFPSPLSKAVGLARRLPPRKKSPAEG